VPDLKIPLTEREKQLLRRLAEGKADDQIASEIGGTDKRIAAQRERLLARLSIGSDSETKGLQVTSPVAVSSKEFDLVNAQQSQAAHLL
jgi:DNA-binding CsgD family transcriptional regulator